MTFENRIPDSLLTLAEGSSFRQTGRTDEVERLCDAFAQMWPEAVRAFEYGRSAEGRPMRALIVSRTGALTAREIRQRNLPLVMLQGGIHPGESDGKDAGFIALRELLSGSVAPGSLEQIAILFVPAFNVDGHERFGRWNRPNQVGPEEMGWRSTAQNLNLNRDYMKADAPEMRAMLRLIDEWDPLVCADLHVTDGADFEPDISLQVEPIHQGDPALYATGVAMRDALIDKLAAQGSLPLPFYPDFVETDDPASGFHRHRVFAALLDGLLRVSQSLHGAGRDAFVEELRHARTSDAQHDHRPHGARGFEWRQVAQRSATLGQERAADRRDRCRARLRDRMARTDQAI